MTALIRSCAPAAMIGRNSIATARRDDWAELDRHRPPR